MEVVVRGRVPRWWSVVVLGYRVARAARIVLRRASKI